MLKNERIHEVVFRAIDEVNLQFSKEQQIERSLDTVLFGESGNLDSLGLISLLVAVEEEIEKEFHVMVNLAVDESAMSEKASPLSTIATLISHISELLEANVSV